MESGDCSGRCDGKTDDGDDDGGGDDENGVVGDCCCTADDMTSNARLVFWGTEIFEFTKSFIIGCVASGCCRRRCGAFG